MHTIRRTAVAAVAALALSVPTAAITASTANAAPGVSQADQHSQVVAKKAKKKLKVKLQKSKAYSHYGQDGVKVTAVVSKGKKKAKGKVTFSVSGPVASSSTKKLKKGKASFQMASTDAPGQYKVTAKYKGKKKSTSIRVYNSAIALSSTALTYSKAAIDAPYPNSFDTLGVALSGTVNFKDAPATTGWVDIYLNGDNKGGASSPNFAGMAQVAADGTFAFKHYQFINDMEDDRAAVPGTTFTYYAFYTDDAGFDDYIYSAPITVTYNP
jgi:hypothetical protein